MKITPPAAAPTESPASAQCGCRPAGCPHCGAGQPSEAALRHRRNLAELGEIGMELARQIRQQMRDVGVLGFQGAKMFDQVTRAVRRAHALEAKIEAESQKSAAERAAQQAAEQAGHDAARQRARTLGQANLAGQTHQAAAAPAKAAGPREGDDLLDDLSDDEDLFDDLYDGSDDEDLFDDLDDLDEDGDAAVGTVMAGVHRTLARARRQLSPAKDSGAVSDTSAAPDDLPAALAWPPR
jgi:hypothetical protein